MAMLDFNDAPRLQVIDPQDYEKRIERLRAHLATSVGDLVRELFPRARIQSHEARIGNVDGDPGESLSIGLQGDRAGLWFDHATGEGGDLIDLWQRATRASDFLQVVEDLERWAGLTGAPRWTSRVHKVGEKRRQEAKATPAAPLGDPSGVWEYLSASGVLLATVRRYDLPEGKKTFRPQLANGAPGMPDPRPLYRLPDLITADEVVLVEGEKCADALASLGIVATTAMGGATANPSKTDWTPLAGKRVTIWPDNDEPGRSMPDRVRPALEAVGSIITVLPIPAGKPLKWDAADAVAEGLNVPELLHPTQPQTKVPIYSRKQLRELKRPDWLVEDVIVEASVISLYGPSGALKSFLAIDFAMSVATGEPWHGRPVKQGPVVYVTGEGRDQIGFRLDAWERLHKYEGDAPIFVVPLGIAISEPEWVGHLVDAIQTAVTTAPAMIWLDTLARTFGAGDENSQKDMNAFVAGVDALRDRFRCVVGIVHHTGKDSDRGLRGSSALYAAMDTVIRTDRKTGKMLVTLKNQQPHGKQKDAAEFDDITLEAKPITLGVDEKGRAITSLAMVLGEAEEPEEGVERPAEPPRGANQKAVLAALKKAKGEPLGANRLGPMAGLDGNRLTEATRALVAKNLIREIEDAGGRRWVMA